MHGTGQGYSWVSMAGPPGNGLSGKVGLWRAHRPGVLGILDEVPSIEQLILHGL